MTNFTTIIGEISDKMPGVSAIWLNAICISVVTIALCYCSRWLYFIFIPLSGIWAFICYQEFAADQYFHDAVITELGHEYMRHAISAGCLPLVVAMLYGIIDIRSQRRDSNIPGDAKP